MEQQETRPAEPGAAEEVAQLRAKLDGAHAALDRAAKELAPYPCSICGATCRPTAADLMQGSTDRACQTCLLGMPEALRGYSDSAKAGRAWLVGFVQEQVARAIHPLAATLELRAEKAGRFGDWQFHPTQARPGSHEQDAVWLLAQALHQPLSEVLTWTQEQREEALGFLRRQTAEAGRRGPR